MFLPNAYSFLLVRLVIKKEVIQSGIFGIQEPATSFPSSSPSVSGSPRFGEAGRKMFLQNSHSFLLARSVIFKPAIQSGIHPVRGDISNASNGVRGAVSNGIQESATSLPPPSSSDSGSPRFGEAGKPTIVNKDKRTFLKLAGIAGASIIGSLLLPKKADALIMGSSPTTGVVGVKNSTNARINPATEETVSSLADLTFDTGSLNVKVTSLPAAGSSSFSDSGDVDKKGLVDANRHVQVDVLSSTLPSSASTETTLQTISYGGVQFALRLATVGEVDYVGEAAVGTLPSAVGWRIKKVDSTTGIIIQWADGTAGFDKIWNNYGNGTYTYS